MVVFSAAALRSAVVKMSRFLSPCPDYPCSGMLGMVSGQISDAQISVSSSADRGWVAENARLLTGRMGWTGQQVKQPFRNEWIQVGSWWEGFTPGGR